MPRNVKTDPITPLKTVKQVALEDNVSEKTVRRAITAGHLEVLRMGPGGRLTRSHPAQHESYRRRGMG